MSAANVNVITLTKKVRKKFGKALEKDPEDFCRISKCLFHLRMVALLKINQENIDGVNVLLASFCDSIPGGPKRSTPL